jgi:hypothetical protein
MARYRITFGVSNAAIFFHLLLLNFDLLTYSKPPLRRRAKQQPPSSEGVIYAAGELQSNTMKTIGPYLFGIRVFMYCQ